MRQFNQCLQFFEGRAAVNAVGGKGGALLNIGGFSGKIQPSGGIRKHDIAHNAFPAEQDVAGDFRVLFSVAAGDAVGGRAQAEFGGRHVEFPNFPIFHLRDARFSGERNFIKPVFAMHEPDMLRVQLLQDFREQPRQADFIDADQLPSRSGRAGDGAENVEHGANADFAARDNRVFHRAVQFRRKQEGDADVIETARHLRGFQINLDA